MRGESLLKRARLAVYDILNELNPLIVRLELRHPFGARAVLIV